MSSTTNKPKAIIYCAENIISGKKYVGQSTFSLQERRNSHYRSTIKYSHKFANALKYYSEQSWKWHVLAEVELEEADEYERFFIADLDTFNNGYNSTKGGGIEGENNFTYNSEILSVYHVKYGVIEGTRVELRTRYPELSRISSLISGRRGQVGGWILTENKDNYKNMTTKNSRGQLITLTHPDYGTYTLLQHEFVSRFNLTRVGVSTLVSKGQKSHKKWRLVDASETKN